MKRQCTLTQISVLATRKEVHNQKIQNVTVMLAEVSITVLVWFIDHRFIRRPEQAEEGPWPCCSQNSPDLQCRPFSGSVGPVPPAFLSHLYPG